MQNPLLAKKSQQDSSRMSNSSNKGNMSHLYAQMQHKQIDQANEAVKLMMEDPDLFDYDGDYDRIQAARKEAAQEKKTDKKESVLLGLRMAAKDKRDRETLIRKERVAEKEIERTNNLGLKEEKFITSSYMKQLEENKKFMDDDNKKEAENDRNSALSKGNMDNFLKKQLAGLNGRADLSKMMDQKNKPQEQSEKNKYSHPQQQNKQQESRQNDNDKDNNNDKQRDNQNQQQGEQESKQDTRPKLSEMYQSAGNQRGRESNYSREQGNDSHKREKKDRGNSRSHSKERKDKHSKGGRRRSSRSQERDHRRDRKRSRSQEDRNKREYNKQNDSSKRDRSRSRSKDKQTNTEKQERSVKIEESKLSKEEKIRLAKERYQQRQQQQQQQPQLDGEK